MNTSAAFVSSVFRVIAQQFAALGYQKRRSTIHTVDLKADVIGWVGLNKAIRGGLRINPVVGVRHQRMEAIIADLQGLKRHAYIPPSVSSPIGYLTPQGTFLSWSYNAETDSETIASRMVETVDTWGKPFMNQNSDLSIFESFVNTERAIIPAQMDYRIIVALTLCGKKRVARDFADEILRKLEKRTDPASNQFRAFVKRCAAYNFDNP